MLNLKNHIPKDTTIKSFSEIKSKLLSSINSLADANGISAKSSGKKVQERML